MFKRILIPLDGSPLAEAALPAGLELATRFDSKITIVRVLQPPHLMITDANGGVYATLLQELREQAEADARIYLQNFMGSLRQQGFDVGMKLVENENIAEAVLDVVDMVKADIIVMSTHGRGGISRWVYGSIADRLLQQADVPILLIRAKEESVPITWDG